MYIGKQAVNLSGPALLGVALANFSGAKNASRLK
jgi:hypothetical protein